MNTQAKRDYLAVAQLSTPQLQALMESAVALKREWQAGGNAPRLKGKTLALVFTKPSLRTRVSFEMGMRQLGGDALYIAPHEIEMGKRESVPDVARVLSRYVDGIMARVHDHADVETLAAYSRVPVINGLSDREHPCQALADLLTIIERFGGVRGVNITYVGDANNVSNSIVVAAAMLGAHVTIASPDGYGMLPALLALAQARAAASGGSVTTMHDPRSAVEDADVLYTDVWTSMGQEHEYEQRAKVFPPYQLNPSLVALARPAAVVMHCLPAHRGMEITDAVADGAQSALWDQAENRLHAQKAILVDLLG